MIFKIMSVLGVFSITDDSPRIVSAKKSVAWLNMAATQTRLFLKPNSLALAIQLSAFGPGIITKSAQKPVKIIQSSRVIDKLLCIK
jgi:hypothetical protein